MHDIAVIHIGGIQAVMLGLLAVRESSMNVVWCPESVRAYAA